MASIYPFRAFRYNSEKAGAPLDKLVTQPYDKITPAAQERYYGLSLHNFVRVVLGKKEPSDNGQNVYTRAAGHMQEWARAGVLAQDPAPALYTYFQEYTVPGAKQRRTRKGFIALGRIEDYSARIVHRHELTHTGPKKDRLELLRHTRAHFGQLFMIYSDPTGDVDKLLDKIARSSAPQEVRDEYDVAHRLWRVNDATTIEKIRKLMADKKLIIADGHHRYETALAYRDECRARTNTSEAEAPHEKVMMTFINMERPGVTILPTHRVVADLPGFHFGRFREAAGRTFDWYAYPLSNGKDKQRTVARLRRDLAERGAQRPSFAVCPAGEAVYYLFLLKVNADLSHELAQASPEQRKLDLVVLHKLLLEGCLGMDEESIRQQKNIRYIREWQEAVGAVESGAAQLAFLVNPTRLEQVRDVALGGEVLPQKSTDFYPKLLSGLTIYRLDQP